MYDVRNLRNQDDCWHTVPIQKASGLIGITNSPLEIRRDDISVQSCRYRLNELIPIQVVQSSIFVASLTIKTREERCLPKFSRWFE